MQREWSVVHFVEDHSVCYVPSSWLVGEQLGNRFVYRCYWPASDNSDEKIRGFIRSCSQPDRETWSLLRCKPKGHYKSTDDALRALKELEGTTTTDTDTASQYEPPNTGENIADKCCLGPEDNVSFHVDPAVTKQLLQTGAKRKYVCFCVCLYVCMYLCMYRKYVSLSVLYWNCMKKMQARIM